jgi:drug/metabolite transporter (DMT)-like permease
MATDAADDATPDAGRAAAEPGARRALAYAVATAVLWGFSFPVGRAALREIAPLALAAGRFALATAVLVPLARRRGLRLDPADRLSVLGLGLLGVTLYFAFENTGLVYTTASHASLLASTVPLGSALWSAWRRRRLPRPKVLAGMGVAAFGVAVLVRPEGGDGTRLLGDLLVLSAMACWVAYTFVARRLTERYPALLVTAATVAVGAATLLPLAAAEALLRPAHLPSPQALGALAYLGLFCSAGAYLLWNIALPLLGVSLTNNLLNLVPLVAVLTGVLALGEPWTWSIGVGGALVLLGVAVVERVGRRSD